MPLNTTYELEIKAWQKELETLQQDNVLLKNQAANIIKEDINRLTLEKMEYFLSSFINKDAVLALLRYDLAEQLKRAGTVSEISTTGMFNKSQEKLRSDMLKMEQGSARLKADFESYASSIAAAS